jgi:nucleotide-binding universal stress UspA family protein
LPILLQQIIEHLNSKDMKNLLIATDFSANAKHAVEYGYNLASQLKANVTLCNAVLVPADMPEAGFVSWPTYEYEELLKESADILKLLKTELEKTINTSGFQPTMGCINEEGAVIDVINRIVAKENINMVIVGTHGSSGLSQFVMGNHTRMMINDTTRPLLLIPPTAKISPIKKVAFATDFKEPEKDLVAIYKLIILLKPLNAELLITHVHDGKEQSPEFKKWLDQFLVEISNKADYPNIYYRLVKNDKPVSGLDWLCEHGHVDILAMVHRERSFFGKMFIGSNTQKMAGHISIPLLVLPETV